MDKKSVFKIIDRFKNLLKSNSINIDKVILYGSYATMTNREDSDIDIIVVSDSFKNKDYWERIDILSDAISKLFEPIEAVAMTKEEWENKTFMVAEYAKNGIML